MIIYIRDVHNLDFGQAFLNEDLSKTTACNTSNLRYSWAAWGTGRIPVGINTSDTNFNTMEKTGGTATVTLTATQIPADTMNSLCGD